MLNHASSVPAGVLAQEELPLPDTLEAVVTAGQLPDDTEDKTEDDGKEDSGGNDGKEPDGDTTGTEDKDSSTGETEEGEPSDSEQEDKEESDDTDAVEETGDEQDTADTEKEENTEESAPSEEQKEGVVSQETEAVTAAGKLLNQILSDYFDGLSTDEIYDAILAMDEDTLLVLTADYEELIAAMTDEDMADGEMQSVIDEIGRGIADALEHTPVKKPVLFRTRAAASEAAAGVSMERISGSGEAFIYHNFVETTSFTSGMEYAFLNGIYSYEDAVASLGSGAILRAGAAENSSLNYIRWQYGVSAAVTTYVDVVTRGKDFDMCKIGGLYKVPDSGTPTEYRYSCGYSGAQNCGPYYAYTYDIAKLTYENVSASLKDFGKQGSSRSEDYIVTLNFDGKTVTLDEESYTVKVTDPDSGAVTIVVSDSDRNQITANFMPLGVYYEGNGNGVNGLPGTQLGLEKRRQDGLLIGETDISLLPRNHV